MDAVAHKEKGSWLLKQMNVIALVQYRYRTLQHMDITATKHYNTWILPPMALPIQNITARTPHPMDVIAREHAYHRRKMLPLQNITTN